MSSDRLTVSLDEDAREALDTITSKTDRSQSELVRRALTFYAANYEAASTDSSEKLEEYYKMLTGGEHVLLDIDFLHCFLDHVQEDGEPMPEFVADADQVSDYHAQEYVDRFDSLDELLEWLSLCGFLTVRRTTENTYHIVFPSADIRWFMTRFIERSVEPLPFDVTINPGVAKVLLVEE
ncbi:ribbon-helix-helix protein, CopG family [Salarchaeum japonicum]|uniref:ribbon-helix-helix protein, CopG family n=1 Tax=Salarchaeum japonicum TaxID=555573 RepID=UPI003C72D7F4